MAPLLGMLASAGLDFVTDLIKDKGPDLAIEGIKKVTGIDISAKTELTPEEVKAIKEQEVQIMEYHYKNTNSARDMQKSALSQDDVFSKRYVYYLATFWSSVGAMYIFLITFTTIPTDNVRFADTVLGFMLGTIVSTIINFFFGSSKGSQDKTELMKGK